MATRPREIIAGSRDMAPRTQAKPGRPAHTPTARTREQVALLVTVGVSAEIIAGVIGINVSTLRKHYADELRTGRATMAARVAGALLTSAMRGNVRAQTFFLATRAGWNAATTRAELDAETVEIATGKPRVEEVADGVELDPETWDNLLPAPAPVTPTKKRARK